MRKLKYAKYIDDQIPETPAVFKKAMQETFDQIERESVCENAKIESHIWRTRRSLVAAICTVALLTTVAVAASNWSTFQLIGTRTGSEPQNADEVMRRNLHQEVVNQVEISVQEAGYDGKTLYVQYAYHMPDVDYPLGTFDAESGMIILDEDETNLPREKYNVGWWIDHLWVDGKSVDMPNGSGSITTGSENPGEIIQTEYWRLDNEEIMLNGKVDISLPIGEIQDGKAYSLMDHPEKYDENGNLLLPEKGVVTFTLDTSDMLSKVHEEHPNTELKMDIADVQVKDVYYSPLSTYITLNYKVKDEAIQMFKEKNGEGFYDEAGNLTYPYGGSDVIAGWVSDLTLVDQAGNEIFPGYYGCEGYGDDWSEYIFPYIDGKFDELYLAPRTNGKVDMKNKIRVK